MNFEELLDLAGDDPILKKEIERAKTEDLDTFTKHPMGSLITCKNN